MALVDLMRVVLLPLCANDGKCLLPPTVEWWHAMPDSTGGTMLAEMDRDDGVSVDALTESKRILAVIAVRSFSSE
jgi:hypothetical protein